MCNDSTFMDRMKRILNFVIAFRKAYNEMFGAAGIEDIVKDMMGYDFLPGVSDYSYL